MLGPIWHPVLKAGGPLAPPTIYYWLLPFLNPAPSFSLPTALVVQDSTSPFRALLNASLFLKPSLTAPSETPTLPSSLLLFRFIFAPKHLSDPPHSNIKLLFIFCFSLLELNLQDRKDFYLLVPCSIFSSQNNTWHSMIGSQ